MSDSVMMDEGDLKNMMLESTVAGKVNIERVTSLFSAPTLC